MRKPLVALAVALVLGGALALWLAATPRGTVAARSTPAASPSPSPAPAASGAAPSPTASASVSSPTAAPALLLGVIGDFGLAGGQAPTMVQVLADYARAHGTGGRFAAVVTTGDNAYEHGTAREVAFAHRLLAPLLGAGTRLVASLGNHDELTSGGAPAQAGFGLPARWYTTTVGPVQLVVLDANHPSDPSQLAWLRTTLRAPRRVPYRVAVFHQPAASCSFHAADAAVDRSWLPLLDKGVDLVLSGHNHTYERFVDRAGLPLVTTGGGGATLYPSSRLLCTGPARPVVLRSTYDVVVLSVADGRMHLVALDRDGRALDSVDVLPR